MRDWLTFKGKHLWINYLTSAAGVIRVEVQDQTGRPLPGYEEEASAEIFGDELERKITWSSNAELRSLDDKPVRLRFVMKDADLFSFRFGDL